MPITFLIFIECTCDPNGAEDGNVCAHYPSGDCKCAAGVFGSNCDECQDGYYGLGQNSISGCKSKIMISILNISNFRPLSSLIYLWFC